MGFFDSLKRLLSSETTGGTVSTEPSEPCPPHHQRTLTETINGETTTTILEIWQLGAGWLFALNDVMYHQLADIPESLRQQVSDIVDTL